MTLNSFRKHCPNVLFVALCFVSNKAMVMGKISVFIHRTKHKGVDQTLGQCFLKELRAAWKKSVSRI